MGTETSENEEIKKGELRMKEQDDVLILFSGGADSRLMLEFAMDLNLKPYCLLINYGQRHIEELAVAQNQLDRLKVSFQMVEIDGLKIQSVLTTGDQNRFKGVSPWHVPGRNLMFVSVAYSIAENMDIPEIWYGPDFSDRLGLFPDCYQDWVVKVDELFKINGSKKINLRAPILGLTKEMVLGLLKNKYKVDEIELHSGYGDIKLA
jgi:7-cyano-7-deazaguanine synthase